MGRAHRYPPNTPFYVFFQQIYVLNFLNMMQPLRFSLENAVYFIMLPFFFVPVLFSFYIQGVLNSGAKRLRHNKVIVIVKVY
jgi:hypothetical protein